MPAIAIQSLTPFTGRNHTYAAIASGDTLVNDGLTVLLFKNSNASPRTLTIAGNAVTRSGLGAISAADMAETVTIPGSGTNGGECMVGVLPPDRFNSSTGVSTLTFDSVVGLTVAAIKVSRAS